MNRVTRFLGEDKAARPDRPIRARLVGWNAALTCPVYAVHPDDRDAFLALPSRVVESDDLRRAVYGE